MKYVFIFLLFCALHSFAKQNAVDSIIQLLKKSKTKTGVDTVVFESALDRIAKVSLNDAAIADLEKA